MPNTFKTFPQFSLKSAGANGCVEVMDRLRHFERAKVHDRVCTHDWLEQLRHFIQYACQNFVGLFPPLHRLGSISVKICCAMCSYTESVNKQKRKERGRHLTVMLMSGPAPLCCFLLLFFPGESCS